MTRGELIDALVRDATVLGHVTNGNEAFTGARGLAFAVEWAEAHVRNFPADRRWALLNERYPHPGPATMAKLEALYLRMTGEKAPHLVTDSV